MKMLRITLEGKSYEVGVEVMGDAVSIPSPAAHSPAPSVQVAPSAAGAPVPVPVVSPSAAVTAAGDFQVIASPMAGNVFKCLIKPGDTVEVNQVVIVLDAMKMETPVVATVAGTVRNVLIKEGEFVEEGHSLVQIEG